MNEFKVRIFDYIYNEKIPKFDFATQMLVEQPNPPPRFRFPKPAKRNIAQAVAERRNNGKQRTIATQQAQEREGRYEPVHALQGIPKP